MPRPRKFVAATIGLGLIAGATADAPAGPISRKFQEWSVQRQVQVRVEKPFSHQTTDVHIGQASYTQSLRQHLPWHKNSATTPIIRKEPVQHSSSGLLLPH